MKSNIKLFEFLFNGDLYYYVLTINFLCDKEFKKRLINTYIFENKINPTKFKNQWHYKLTTLPIKDREFAEEHVIWSGFRQATEQSYGELIEHSMPRECKITERKLILLPNDSRDTLFIKGQAKILSPRDKAFFDFVSPITREELCRQSIRGKCIPPVKMSDEEFKFYANEFEEEKASKLRGKEESKLIGELQLSEKRKNLSDK
jgi:hypothetical protein